MVRWMRHYYSKILFLLIFIAVQFHPQIGISEERQHIKNLHWQCRASTGDLWGFTWPAFGNQYEMSPAISSKNSIVLGMFSAKHVGIFLEKLKAAQRVCDRAHRAAASDEMLYRHLMASLKEKFSDDSFSKLKVLAERGYVPAQGLVSLIYYKHFGDYRSARHWAEIGHANENPAASEILGHLYGEGKVLEQDLSKAIQLYETAANGGSSDAVYHLYLIHGDEASENFDKPKSDKYLNRAHSRGNASASIQIGIQYAFGIGREIDKDKAFEHIKLAIDRGDFMNGYFNMGLLYASLEPFKTYRFAYPNFYINAKDAFETAIGFGYKDASLYVVEMEKLKKSYGNSEKFKRMLRDNYNRVVARRQKWLRERAERYRANNDSIGGPEILLGIIGVGILLGSLSDNPSVNDNSSEIWKENRRNLNRAITPMAVDLWLQ